MMGRPDWSLAAAAALEAVSSRSRRPGLLLLPVTPPAACATGEHSSLHVKLRWALVILWSYHKSMSGLQSRPRAGGWTCHDDDVLFCFVTEEKIMHYHDCLVACC